MHRRWMSLPLFTTTVSAFYPYHEGTQGDNRRRFIPLHPFSQGSQDDLVTVDIKKVYHKRDNKFPVVLSNPPSVQNALAISQDGSDYSYFSTISFGSKEQEMYMLIDTGSANTWVMGQGCASQSCTIHNLFGQDDSTTLNVTTNNWSLSYGTGTVSGVVASDTVKFANFALNMSFGLATTASDDFNSYPMDGILGLGRAPSNELGVPTLMDNLKSQGNLTQKILGIHLNRGSDDTKDGEIVFGGVDTGKYTGEICFTQTSNAAAWEIPVDDMFVNSTACGFKGKSAVVDTGTSYILMPPPDAKQVHSLISGSVNSGETYTVPCDSTEVLQVSFSGVKYTISPKDYVGKPSTGNMCNSNIIGHQAFGPDEWILGDVFLKNVYAVFDFDQARIGFGMLGSGGNSTGVTTSTATTSTTPTSSTQSTDKPTSTRSASSQSTSAVIGNPFDNGSSESHRNAATVVNPRFDPTLLVIVISTLLCITT